MCDRRYALEPDSEDSEDTDAGAWQPQPSGAAAGTFTAGEEPTAAGPSGDALQPTAQPVAPATAPVSASAAQAGAQAGAVGRRNAVCVWRVPYYWEQDEVMAEGAIDPAGYGMGTSDHGTADGSAGAGAGAAGAATNGDGASGEGTDGGSIGGAGSAGTGSSGRDVEMSTIAQKMSHGKGAAVGGAS